MMSVVLVGVLTLVEKCHDFDCKVISRPNTECTVATRIRGGRFGKIVGQADSYGTTFDMQWFQTGETDGFFGQTGMRTLSIFYKKGHPTSAYTYFYVTNRDYQKRTCRISP